MSWGELPTLADSLSKDDLVWEVQKLERKLLIATKEMKTACSYLESFGAHTMDSSEPEYQMLYSLKKSLEEIEEIK